VEGLERCDVVFCRFLLEATAQQIHKRAGTPTISMILERGYPLDEVETPQKGGRACRMNLAVGPFLRVLFVYLSVVLPRTAAFL
jgi:hypothetical protein